MKKEDNDFIRWVGMIFSVPRRDLNAAPYVVSLALTISPLIDLMELERALEYIYEAGGPHKVIVPRLRRAVLETRGYYDRKRQESAKVADN